MDTSISSSESVSPRHLTEVGVDDLAKPVIQVRDLGGGGQDIKHYYHSIEQSATTLIAALLRTVQYSMASSTPPSRSLAHASVGKPKIQISQSASRTFAEESHHSARETAPYPLSMSLSDLLAGAAT
jgi:hypothetical protein